MTDANELAPQPGELRVLHIEDNDVDAELVAQALRKGGLSVSMVVVQEEIGFVRELQAHVPTWYLPTATCRSGKAWKRWKCCGAKGWTLR